MTTDSQNTYQPRNRVFFGHAWCLLAAALQPQSAVLHKADKDQAEETAELCARVLDSGTVPKDFVLPAHQRALVLAEQKIAFDVNKAGDNEHYRASARKALEAQGPILPREEILKTNERQIEALADVSDLVRDTALQAAESHLTARPGITGAVATRADALGIVIEEIERALRLHARVGNVVKGLSSLPAEEQEAAGVRAYPFTTGLAVAEILFGAATDEAVDAAEGEKEAAADPHASPSVSKALAPAAAPRPSGAAFSL